MKRREVALDGEIWLLLETLASVGGGGGTVSQLRRRCSQKGVMRVIWRSQLAEGLDSRVQGRGVVEPNVLAWNVIHRNLPKNTSGSAGASLSHRGPKPFR